MSGLSHHSRAQKLFKKNGYYGGWGLNLYWDFFLISGPQPQRTEVTYRARGEQVPKKETEKRKRDFGWEIWLGKFIFRPLAAEDRSNESCTREGGQTQKQRIQSGSI